MELILMLTKITAPIAFLEVFQAMGAETAMEDKHFLGEMDGYDCVAGDEERSPPSTFHSDGGPNFLSFCVRLGLRYLLAEAGRGRNIGPNLVKGYSREAHGPA
ncbi:hypothetical protein CRG98_018635 [Punica granatum]|uniref:Uncharacterized protein n=1 Tax=Punica granatum TaxID=22663 RepID=A0A2I0JXJ2_PUNGR|nr:hypothetical protein CRG98_018635 [Punica granatum]